MKLKSAWGIDINDIKNKQHNIWVGISFANKDFTDNYTRELLDTAVSYTKKYVLVWLPGRMHATNYYYFDKLSRADSLKKAYQDEQRMRDMLEKYIYEKKYKNVSVASYDDVLTPDFIKRRDVFFREFANQEDFYETVCDIVKDFLKVRNRPIEKKRIESVALYILQELPAMVGGLQTFENEIHYGVLLYPGIDKLDVLAQDLREGKNFSEMTKKLNVTHQVGVLDV